jgi:apolipoprotein N-acyltransferase
MSIKGLVRLLPSWQNALLAVASAFLLMLAFPPFEWWFMAWFALVPLLWAIEGEKGSIHRSLVLGWLFGNVFFYGTCWWLTYAPITYAGFPAPLAYMLLLGVTSLAAVFPGLFASVAAVLLKRFGSVAFLVVPFVWVFTEFARYWVTGNSWNAVGYSQAFVPNMMKTAAEGGVYLVGFLVVLGTSLLAFGMQLRRNSWLAKGFAAVVAVLALISLGNLFRITISQTDDREQSTATVVALQPNVPMSGLTIEKWRELRRRHIRLAESALNRLKEQQTTNNESHTTVIFPESPMNFMYEDEPETKQFINSFAAKHNVSVLFNSAEPDASNGKYFNSAVLVGPEGKEIVQYDKIYLLPFGEAVPFPLEPVMPAFVGSFSHGKEYDLLPLGDAKAGVMICFESHFGQLSREYVRRGADVIIEMTNDGYLGPTPVLRQHLANAVFRAVETNRPVLRVTNVGITTYINERGEVIDPAVPYTEDTRVWAVAKSDGSQTFYVKYGDWFAWLCSAVTVGLVAFAFMRKQAPLEPRAVSGRERSVEQI